MTIKDTVFFSLQERHYDAQGMIQEINHGKVPEDALQGFLENNTTEEERQEVAQAEIDY